MTYKILKGNSLDLLPTLADNSIDAIVTDPPYGLANPDPDYIIKAIQQWASGDRAHIPEGKGFMGKSWDSFVPPPAIWDECLRVLKPGGHLLAFAGTRTYDLMGISIRMAGFEIRDSIGWVYGSGFPKSLDVSKAIDKAAGAEREVIDTLVSPFKIDTGAADAEYSFMHGTTTMDDKGYRTTEITAPTTPEAQQWQGWGTALKPALEPIVVARKPLIGTVAENVLTHGTGGLNIDASRIGTDEVKQQEAERNAYENSYGGYDGGIARHNGSGTSHSQGRWPANLILDEYTAELLDEQSGNIKTGKIETHHKQTAKEAGIYGHYEARQTERGYGDSGGASRFFYVAKASKRDRNEGLEDLPAVRASAMGYDIGLGESGEGMFKDRNPQKQNFHPTVKPTELMRYLVKLITPPGGTVLDPFTGSGSTGKAAILEGFDFIGIELTEDYWPIIEGRLKHAEAKVAEAKENIEATPQGLF
jgi:site-specific DNA-methyltransferase (adenine-specific)